jgi:hypothetical protein
MIKITAASLPAASFVLLPAMAPPANAESLTHCHDRHRHDNRVCRQPGRRRGWRHEAATRLSFRRHFPAKVISHAVWLVPRVQPQPAGC